MSEETPVTPSAAPPSPVNAFSGIRWSVNEIENLAIQAYWVDEAQWDAIQTCLADAIKCLQKLNRESKDSCPWPSCGEGCKPVCE